MSWATNHTVIVTIDGVDQSASIMPGSLYVRQQVGNDAGVASFRIWDNSGNLKPGGWDVVTIAINGATVFGGFVTGVDVSALDTVTGTSYTVECKDWSILLDTVTVNKSYGPYDTGATMVDYTDKTIVANLFSTYLNGEGFDASTNVNAQKTAMEIGFENVSLRAALNALAVRAGADWFIDGSKNLWWFNPASPGNAAFAISSDNPDYSATYPPLRGSITRNVDTLNVSNSVIVMGGYIDTRTSETFTYRDGKSVYSTVYKPIKSVIQVRANTTVSGPLPATTDNNRLGFAPEDRLVADGGECWYLIDQAAGTLTIDAVITVRMVAGDTIAIDYVYLNQVLTTASDAASIATYGRTIKRTFYNPELTSETALEEYAAQILEENAYGRETITLEVAEYGLLAGKLLTVNVGEVDVGGTEDLLLEQTGDRILSEASANIITDESEVSRTFLIQQVEYRPIVTADDTYLMVCAVTAGYYRSTLIEALTRLGQAAGIGSSSGPLSAIRYPGKLGAIASDLGEVVAGRVVLTDGGTAPFDWDSYHGHTGVIAGLDASGTIPYGSLLLLEGGTVRAKIGKLDGLSGPGTHTPTGWGMWTSQGYFSGTVSASYLSGGTIIATAGSIGNWTIEANKLYTSNGTIQIGSAPSQVVNSANPGVRLDQTGLYGYGTIGNTFALYTDGRPPLISSGTIKEMVFEAYTAGVFRTGPTVNVNGGVQVDSSGIFAYSPAGALKFQVDAATGLLTATDGIFSGTVSASQVSGGTVSGGLISGGTVTGALVSGGTVDGSKFTVAGGTVVIDASGPVFKAGTVHTLGDSAADVRWTNGGTVITYIKTEFNATQNKLSVVAHDAGSRTGYVEMVTQDSYLSITDTATIHNQGNSGTVTFQGLGKMDVQSALEATGVITSQTKLAAPAIVLASSASLVSGPGAPSAGLGVNGDIYFDSTAGSANFMYRKEGGAWVLLVTT